MRPSWRNIHKIDHGKEKMDKSSRQEGSNPLRRKSLLAAKLKSAQCGNVLVCLWGHWSFKHSLKANVIFSMYLGKYIKYCYLIHYQHILYWSNNMHIKVINGYNPELHPIMVSLGLWDPNHHKGINCTTFSQYDSMITCMCTVPSSG